MSEARLMLLLLLSVAVLLYFAAASPAAPLIANPSFEDDGAAIRGVGYVRDGNGLSGWTMLGDGEAGRNVAGGPFADNGRIPDGKVAAVLQNRSVLRQEIGPLEPDAVYRLTLRANGRATDLQTYGRGGKLLVRLNGTTLIGPVEVKAVEAAGSHESDYRALEATFSTGGGKCRLDLAQVDEADGICVLADDLRLELQTAGGKTPIRVNRAHEREAAEPPVGVDFRRTQWIWHHEATDPLQAAPPQRRCFRRSFTIADPARVARALILASADNRAEVFVNGAWFGSADSFSAWYEMEFTSALRAGRNVIALECFNAGDTPNPAGVAAMAILYDASGQVLQALPTDASWHSSAGTAEGWQAPEYDDAVWPAALALGGVGCQPWGNFGFLTWLVPEDFPRFTVPGQERYTELLRQLFWLHHSGSGPKATLWDGWLSMSSLWPATGTPGASPFRPQWRGALSQRRLDSEGYVSTHQHHGFGHGEGWPFPTCYQAGGAAWQFANAHTAYRVPATRKVDGWKLTGLQTEQLSETAGWSLSVTGEEAVLETPRFDIDSFVAPFVRLEWAPRLPPNATATLQWTRADAPDFSADRSVTLPLQPDAAGGAFTDVPLYRSPGWRGRLTGLRLTFRNAGGGSLRLLGLITATDNRHPVNNSCYLQGCTEYYNWTGDRQFLRENLGRMRDALAYAIKEFGVAEHGYVTVPWVGHSGRAGWTVGADGKKTIRAGEGIGANYWDLLPFSGRDCLATIYLYDALLRMAALEEALAAHPHWDLPPAGEWSAPRLRELGTRVAAAARSEFWNPATGRFVACRDTDGVAHDYGYTFVNCEAVYYGLADKAQARSIVDWLDGRRSVAGDTSVGEDIYHFRFGPRATTRRNVDWYSFVWDGPEAIPWGGQVQDGGAVLGFAFHDQMARLMSAGPDNAWAALKRTLDWFADVRGEGGYRAYYAKPGRGTLQGGGPPGGLGLDCEFFESVLVPQVMLYGFLGFRAEPEGFRLDPRLPREWPSLTITRIHYRDSLLTITATNRRWEITAEGGPPEPVWVTLPSGWHVEGAPASVQAPGGGSRVPVGLGEGVTIVAVRS